MDIGSRNGWTATDTGSAHRIVEEHDGSARLASMFWAWLGRLDEHIGTPAPDTVGQTRGARFHVQWWVDPSGQFFAAQVMDATACGTWEVFHVPASTGKAVAGRSLCMGTAQALAVLDAMWGEVFEELLGEAAPSTRHPAFVELVAAGTSPAGVVSVQDDQARIARLQSDVAYWTHLAKTLDKASSARGGTYTPAVTLPPAHEPAVPPAQARQWALKDIAEWAQLNADRIIIQPRAISATKRSPYESPALLYQCLELLATEYTQVKTGKADRHAFKDKADAMGIDFRGSVDPSVAGELGDMYFVRVGGRRRFLDQHLAKGNSRDLRFCLRIYFCWDPDQQRVIVGHLPSHLPNSLT